MGPIWGPRDVYFNIFHIYPVLFLALASGSSHFIFGRYYFRLLGTSSAASFSNSFPNSVREASGTGPRRDFVGFLRGFGFDFGCFWASFLEFLGALNYVKFPIIHTCTSEWF